MRKSCGLREAPRQSPSSPAVLPLFSSVEAFSEFRQHSRMSLLCRCLRLLGTVTSKPSTAHTLGEPRSHCPELCTGTFDPHPAPSAPTGSPAKPYRVTSPHSSSGFFCVCLIFCFDRVWRHGCVFKRALSPSGLNFQTARRGFGCK